MSFVDLNELAERESERVEWKENVADIDDVAKTAVAFANDYANLGGGYIVCGAKETQDEFGFQKMLRVGLTSSRLKEVENKLSAVLRENVTPPITPLVEEIPVDEEHRILVFILSASPAVHTLKQRRRENGVCYYRCGRETRVAQNGIMMELLARKNVIEPWDRRSTPAASLGDIDLLALRDILQEIGVWKESTPLENYLSPTERIYALTPPLAVSEPLTQRLCPRHFTLLLFGKNPPNFFPGAYTIFSVYRGTDRSEPNALRHEIIGNVVYQARRCIELLHAESYTLFDKQSEMPNRQKYPQRALQEAVVNALVHRDYENDQPTRITVFDDRIEFNSPGALPRSVDKGKFMSGKAAPHWRNQSLAFFFNKLQLAQAEGQGIPTILRTMKEEGCPQPVFEFETENVICTLPAHPRYTAMKRNAKHET